VHKLGSSSAATGVPLVERSRLLALLRDKADVPVVSVHAGAGFGKTTLAAQWADRDPRPHLIVRSAPFLDDPATLATSLLNALEPVGPGVGEVLTAVTGTEPAFSARLLPALTRLAAARESAFVLVVDDIQLLTRPECHDVLQAVAEGVPPGSQVVFLSRSEPPPWLARVRAAGRLLVLGPGHLAFDDQESRLLIEGAGLALTEDQAADLVARAEGWPVGLYLMLLALQTHGHRIAAEHSLAVAASDRFIVDYLRAEVLAGLPARMRDFLRRTSVLDELSGPLCDVVVGRHDSAAVLSELASRLQLVVAVDAGAHRYRCHHLLGEALKADLEGQEPWLAPELHLRAADWYESCGDRDRAVRHSKAAGDLPHVGTLVWSGVPSCIATGRLDRLAMWLADLDDVQIRSDRWLALAAAWLGLQAGDPDMMTRWLLAAEDHAGPEWETRVPADRYAACLALIHVLVGDYGLERSIVLCRGAQQGLPRNSGFRASAFFNEGVALTLTRRFLEGLASLQEAERLGRALDVPIIEANALAWQGMLTLLTGDSSHAALLITRASDLVQEHRLDRLATSANCITAVALLQAIRGDKERARVTLGTARRLTSLVSRIAPWFAVAGPLVQARAAILLGDGGLARTLCSEAESHMSADLADTVLHDFLAETEARLRTFQSEWMYPEALTAAELRVLQFLPSRLTFPQIGEHLFLSRTTIKTHAMAIYRKLGVSTRDEAVARAGTLGLVEAPLLAGLQPP